MKKYLLLCIVVWSFILTSCTTRPSEVVSKNIDLTVVSSPNGLYASNYASGDTGCYEIIRWTSGDANIVYNDIESSQRIFLSSDVLTDSSSIENTSLIENTAQGCSILRAGNYIYIISRGSANPTYESDREKTTIQQRALSGALLNEIVLPSNVVLNEQSAIAFDNENLYFITHTYYFEEDKPVKANIELISLNQSTFELTKIYEFEDFNLVSLISAFDNNIILRVIQRVNNTEYESSLYVLDVVNSTLSYVENINRIDSVMAIENILYVMNRETGEIRIFDTEKMESNTYFLKDFLSFDQCGFIAEPIDNKLFVHTYDIENGISKRYVLDTQTFKITELDYYNGDMFIGPFSYRGDYLLVITNEKLVNFWDIAPDKKTKFLSERIDYDYAWIHKDDYFNNRPNFIPIESLIEYR